MPVGGSAHRGRNMSLAMFAASTALSVTPPLKLSADERNYENPFEKYDAARHVVLVDGEVAPEWKDTIMARLIADVRIFEQKYPPDKSKGKDYSVYTGSTGVALTCLKLARRFVSNDEDRKMWLHKAWSYVEAPLAYVRSGDSSAFLTFICGDPGVFAVSAHVLYELGHRTEAVRCVHELSHFAQRSLSRETEPNEHLYGYCGLIYALEYAHKVIPGLESEAADRMLATAIAERVVMAGLKNAKHDDLGLPLMYSWHGKRYLGAAHGIAGIMYTLLGFPSLVKTYDVVFRETIDGLATLKFESGNYPSSPSSTSDQLVQWCHGATGFVFLFSRAYEVFKDGRYLRAAIDCGQVVWRRGILAKGRGLCHGTAGNGYIFLCLYRLTGDLMQLYRALRFASLSVPSESDHPWSLFEGLAGTIHYQADVLSPAESRFPGFELP